MIPDFLISKFKRNTFDDECLFENRIDKKIMFRIFSVLMRAEDFRLCSSESAPQLVTYP